jgi:hypothetical protein
MSEWLIDLVKEDYTTENKQFGASLIVTGVYWWI